LLRAGLRALIEVQPDLEVVGEARNASETLQLVQQLTPHLVTLDLSMPGAVGTNLIESLQKHSPATRILVLTMHDDPAYLRAALAAGAAGYFVKAAAAAELLGAVRQVHRGRMAVNVSCEEPAGIGPSLSGCPPSLLSPREVEVLALLARGHTNREIGAQMFLSIKTIETYRKRLLEKLGLRSRAELVRYAVATGLQGPSPCVT